MFAFTLKENISSFKCDDSDKVIDAANKAGIAKYIENLPDEYNTFISKRFCESGVDFSGGEQQKIAIARAYYKNNSLITILDEPTSALDPKAEYRIYKEFNDLILKKLEFIVSDVSLLEEVIAHPELGNKDLSVDSFLPSKKSF